MSVLNPHDACVTVPATDSSGDTPGSNDIWPNTNIATEPMVAVWLAGVSVKLDSERCQFSWILMVPFQAQKSASIAFLRCEVL